MSAVTLGGCNREAADSAPSHVSFRAPIVNTAAVEVPATAQWAGWRGGQLQAVSPASRLPSHWTEQHGVRWKISVPGRGNSSPIVWDEHLFITSIIPAADGEQAALLCFDRLSGALRWQQPIGTPQGSSHNKNGFASATPVTDGAHVYAAFGQLGISAFDFAGQLVWHVPLAQHKHEWGTAASPLLFEDLLIHVVDGDSDSAIIAFDKLTGQQVWRTPRDSRGSWSSPVLVNAGTTEMPQWELVVNGTGSPSGSSGLMIGYDPRTGAELWHCAGTTDIPCPTAIAGEGVVVSSSGSNGPVFAVRPGGQGDVAPSHRVWMLPTGGPYVPTGVIYQKRLYIVSDAGMVSCLRLQDGTNLWRKRLQGAFSASLVAGANQVYAINERGDIYVFRAGETFELIATNRLHEPCVATPAIAHGELYLRSQQHLYCIAEVNLAASEPADRAPGVDPAAIRSPADLDPNVTAPPAAVQNSTLSQP